jgi:hypothetical protein
VLRERERVVRSWEPFQHVDGFGQPGERRRGIELEQEVAEVAERDAVGA